ncbi:MAG: SH3 domain-containing protein [Coraliomargarita sp.]
MKPSTYALLLVLLIVPLFNLSATDSFSRGLKAYEAGNFSSAAEHFQSSVEDSETSAARHNLALSLFQSGKQAEAAWQLERAIRIEPFKDEFRFKSEALREHLGLMPQRPSWHQLFAETCTRSQWAWIAIAGIWLTVLSIVLPIASRYPAGLAIRSVRTIGLITVLIAVPGYALQQKLNQIGVVISEQPLALHAAPAQATPETGTARPGERARVIDQHGDYYRIETEGQATGWIAAESFRPLICYATDA